MADVIRLADGSVQTVFDLRDMMELIDTHMGDEARRWLEDHLFESDDQEYIADLEDEIKRLKDDGVGQRLIVLFIHSVLST